jgi:hypothetical protein
MEAAEAVGTGCRDEAVDFAPGEENDTAQQNEQHRVAAIVTQGDNAQADASRHARDDAVPFIAFCEGLTDET